MKNALQLLRERLDAEKPVTYAEAIVKALEAQGCTVTRYGEEGAWDEYDVVCPSFEGVFMSITLWTRDDGQIEFSLSVDAVNPEVRLTVGGKTKKTDRWGVTNGPILHVKKHGKITIRGKFEKREFTW